MLIKIRYIDNALAYFTQNNVYTVIGLDCQDAHPKAYVFDDNGDLRKTNPINDTNTNQWEIVSVEYGVSVAVYP
jgi:hypothetical protein